MLLLAAFCNNATQLHCSQFRQNSSQVRVKYNQYRSRPLQEHITDTFKLSSSIPIYFKITLHGHKVGLIDNWNLVQIALLHMNNKVHSSIDTEPSTLLSLPLKRPDFSSSDLTEVLKC